MTYQEAYQKATGELKAAGIPEPESDAWILLEHVTGMTGPDIMWMVLKECRKMKKTGSLSW